MDQQPNGAIYRAGSSLASEWAKRKPQKEDLVMLGIIAVVLIVLWLLGFITSNTMGGFIHILLVVAVIVVLVRSIQGRRL